MTENSAPSMPSWVPASVASAYRKGTASKSDLLSGAAFRDMLRSLGRAADVVRGDDAPRGAVDQAAGFRHLLVLLALAVDEALRVSDPYDPHIAPANVDAVFKWGMDCPDAAYSGAAIRGDRSYRVRGRRGDARYVGLQVMAGMASVANVLVDDLDLHSDGSFELVLSTDPRPGNWQKLEPGATSLVVRQFFYDWANEGPAELEIECIDAPDRSAATGTTENLMPGGVANQLVAVGEFVEASLRFWADIERAGRAGGVNAFREPANRTDIGGAAENVSVWGSWEIGPDEALVVEVTPPEALYWSVALGNHWWETIDYAVHQSSLNGFQAAIDDDGAFRAVIAQRDPGVANWLDTAGHSQGPVIFRWLRASAAPVPETRLVAFDDVSDAVPEGTRMVGPEQRAASLAQRRAGVRRRFAR
jgi:Protein of unknown function (DUF1214)